MGIREAPYTSQYFRSLYFGRFPVHAKGNSKYGIVSLRQSTYRIDTSADRRRGAGAPQRTEGGWNAFAFVVPMVPPFGAALAEKSALPRPTRGFAGAGKGGLPGSIG